MARIVLVIALVLVRCGGSSIADGGPADAARPVDAPDGGAIETKDAGDVDANAPFDAGSVADACETAAAESSHLGCEFWATVTANVKDIRYAQPSGPDLELSISNPHERPCRVRVTRAEATIAEVVIDPRAVAVVPLPTVRELLLGYVMGQDFRPTTSTVLRDGAFRVQSELPVTVQQIDRLHDDGASMVLPAHALGRSHYAVTLRDYFRADDYRPAYVTIVGAEESAVDVTVRITATATFESVGTVLSSPAGTMWLDPEWPRLRRGASATIRLEAGDVLQIATSGGVQPRFFASGSLTGTWIEATGRIAVFSGNAWTDGFTPPESPAENDFAARDHTVEQLWPIERWASEAAVAIGPAHQGGRVDAVILSASDDNVLSFDPPVVEATTRGRDTRVTATESFVVRGTHPLMVVRLLGRTHEAVRASDWRPFTTHGGYPSFVIASGRPQFVSEHQFLVPTRTPAIVDIVAPTDAPLFVDGVAQGALTPIGESGLGHLRAELAGGVHRVSSAGGASVHVYGGSSYAFSSAVRLGR